MAYHGELRSTTHLQTFTASGQCSAVQDDLKSEAISGECGILYPEIIKLHSLKCRL